MRTQSPDTSPEAERILIERIRQAPVSRRFRLVQSLSQRMLSGHNPELEARTEAIHAVVCGYGKRIGQLVQMALATRPEWKEQSVDLTAILFPVMEALGDVDIASYIGGSIASSIHGMQQSASDIDLVLLHQGQGSLSVGTVLMRLQDRYLIEPEAIIRPLNAGTSISLIHVDTLMKIDLILPSFSNFEKAMQAQISSLLIDERYAPFPVASALEMSVWKLVRCAREYTMSAGSMINDAEWNDVLGMLKVQKEAVDLEQLAYWTQIMNAGSLLPQVLDDAGICSR